MLLYLDASLLNLFLCMLSINDFVYYGVSFVERNLMIFIFVSYFYWLHSLTDPLTYHKFKVQYFLINLQFLYRLFVFWERFLTQY